MDSTNGNSVTLHRVFRAPVGVVYKACIDGKAKCKWLPPYGFTGEMHHNDPKVGGTYRMSFTNFRTGASHSFGGTYTELVPNSKIKYSDSFDDSNLPGMMHVTITFTEVLCGTEVHIVQENIPSAIPVELCYLGWQESLLQLAQLVEPDIKD